MTTTAVHDTHVQDATPRRRMGPARKVALAGGIAYLITFAASIPQLKLFADVIDDPAGYISGQHSNTTLLWGSWLEVVTAVACVGTAVALYPVTRRVSRTAAIGFVTSRVVEATLILVGVMSLLSLVTLQGDFAGATGAQAEALFLGTALYRGRLVPRIIPTIGLVGAPIILVSATATIFGGWDQTSAVGALCALPIAIWELSLGVWLTVKGFTRTPA